MMEWIKTDSAMLYNISPPDSPVILKTRTGLKQYFGFSRWVDQICFAVDNEAGDTNFQIYKHWCMENNKIYFFDFDSKYWDIVMSV